MGVTVKDLSPPLLFFSNTGRNPWPVLSAFRAPTSIGVTHSLSGRSINRSHPCLLVLYQHCLKDFQVGFNFEDLVYSQLSLSQDFLSFNRQRIKRSKRYSENRINTETKEEQKKISSS